MKLCVSAKCVFDCPEIGEETNSLTKAMEWRKNGHSVNFEYDGEYVGYVSFGGTCKKVEDLPEDADYGVVFYCEETESFQINVPDEILEKMPEM